MTRRSAAIEAAIIRMHGCDLADCRATLSDLIDQAEAGKLKEPLPITYSGMNGTITVQER